MKRPRPRTLMIIAVVLAGLFLLSRIAGPLLR